MRVATGVHAGKRVTLVRCAPLIAALASSACGRTPTYEGMDASVAATPVTCGRGTVLEGRRCVAVAPTSGGAGGIGGPAPVGGRPVAGAPVGGSAGVPFGGVGAMGGFGGMPVAGMPVGGIVTVGPMCNPSIAPFANCNGVSCPPPVNGQACTVPCCTAQNQCGFRTTLLGAETTCLAPPPRDPDCPNYDGITFLEGCCYDGSRCGFISTASNTCVLSMSFIPDLADRAGAPCDGDGDADGGT